jgi:RNA polymerase sigma-70 factor (ECF subfamily)
MTQTATIDRLTDLHTRYASILLFYLNGFTDGNRQSAEDLLQETMIRAWRHMESVPQDPDQTRRWMFTVARNVAIDAIRRKRTRPSEVELFESDSLDAGPDTTTDTVMAMETLRTALTSLSRSQRFILTELYLRGRTANEAARRLGVPVGTVKSRAHYALRSLRAAIACPVE